MTVEILQDYDDLCFWDGPDKYFHSVEEAIEYIADDVEDEHDERIPDVLYVADHERPKVPVSLLTETVGEYLDDNYPGDDDYPSDHCNGDLKGLGEALEPILQKWVGELNWFIWKPNMKQAVRVKETIQAKIREWDVDAAKV